MTPNPLQPFLQHQGFVLLDGGLATALEERGHVLDKKLWSAGLLTDDPEAIRAVHADYLEAGADCIATATYQASFAGFLESGMTEREAAGLFELSVRLAVEARDDFWARSGGQGGRRRPIVAASLGPYGAYLADGSEYDGRYGIGRDALDDFHRRRFELVAASETDIVAFETIPSALEAEVILDVVDGVPDAWVWLSFSCRDGAYLRDGTPYVDVVRLCSEHERICSVGVNCTAPEFVPELLEAARTETDLPLFAYPNSGERYDAVTKTWSGDVSTNEWLSCVDAAVAAGAEGVGGCCRVGPEMIRETRVRVARLFSAARDGA